VVTFGSSSEVKAGLLSSIYWDLFFVQMKMKLCNASRWLPYLRVELEVAYAVPSGIKASSAAQDTVSDNRVY
jgi:hypothetical protein